MLQLSNLSTIDPIGAAVQSVVNDNLTHCRVLRKVSNPPIVLICACERTGTDDIIVIFAILMFYVLYMSPNLAQIFNLTHLRSITQFRD